MTTTIYVRRMAAYNRWMNEKVYAATSRLPVEERSRDRGAFFRSILGTLNHLAVGDTLWLQRFARHASRPPTLAPLLDLPTPVALDEILFQDLSALRARRDLLDAAIIDWAAALTEPVLASTLKFETTKGLAIERPLDELLMHFFNHQTHHRGQVTTLLTQAGEDVGVTDLMAMPAGVG
jgi:uncharacterized damage-inducible protein DinB